MPVKGMLTPRRYSKTVSKREKTKSLLKGLERDSPAMAVAAGVGIGAAARRPFSGAAFGWIAGTQIARYAKRKHAKLSLRTIAELSGRPKLAGKMLPKFSDDPYLQSLIRGWAKHGKRMSKAERDRFVKKTKSLADAANPVKSYLS